MKKILLLSFLLPLLAVAQTEFRHLDAIKLNKMKVARTENMTKIKGNGSTLSANEEAVSAPLTIFMRVADDATVSRLEQAGAEVSLRAGNIVIVETTLDQAEALAAIEGVITVSLSEELRPYAFESELGYDLSRQWLGLDKIQSAASPLTKVYGGQGVVLGILDNGVDPNHILFNDENGNTRVKRIMNHVQVGSNKFTQKVETPEGVRKFKSDADGSTHGTHTLGIAAGSFVNEADGVNFTGAAPLADIAIKCGVPDNARLIQGLQYITDYAKSEGKPCVINISLGSNSGPHDGTDEFPAALQTFAEKDGVTICVSAGNEGADQAFMYHDAGADSAPLKTFIAPNYPYTDFLYSQVSVFPMYPQAIGSLEIWSDDDTPFNVYFDVYDISSSFIPQSLAELKIEPNKVAYMTSAGAAPVTNPDVLVTDNAVFNGIYLNSYVGGASRLYPANNRFCAEVSFQLECTNDKDYRNRMVSLRIEPGKPNQKFYVYGHPMAGYFGYALAAGNYELFGFSGSNAEGSINSLAGAKDAITVGSYVTHNVNPQVAPPSTPGTTSDFSSWGRTPDGRMHPQISAPGQYIVSGMNSYYYKLLSDEDKPRATYYTYTDGEGKEHRWTMMSGTSMSSPYMAGTVATWLSAEPGLTTAQILEIAQETASQPVEARPGDGCGYFLDSFKGLCKVLSLSGVNDIRNDVEIPYSVARNGNTFVVQAPAADAIRASVYNLNGTLMFNAATEGQQLDVDASALTPGIYVLSLRIGDTVHSEKIAVK